MATIDAANHLIGRVVGLLSARFGTLEDDGPLQLVAGQIFAVVLQRAAAESGGHLTSRTGRSNSSSAGASYFFASFRNLPRWLGSRCA